MASAGRPTRDENRLQSHAARACSRAVRLILAEAARRKFTLASFVRLAEIDRKTLYDLIEAESPRAGRLERFTQALGLPPHAARALCHELTQRDHEEIRRLMRADVGTCCRDIEPTIQRLNSELEGLLPEQRIEALDAFVLAQCGINDVPTAAWSDESSRWPALSPGLLALDLKLEQFGSDFKLRDFVDGAVDIALRGGEANAALRWLSRSLRLNAGQQSQLREMLSDRGPFVAYDEVDFERAYDAAIRAFRATLPRDAQRITAIRALSDEELREAFPDAPSKPRKKRNK
jgi:hypothetical protein